MSSPAFPIQLNARAAKLLSDAEQNLDELKIKKLELACGASVYDFGIQTAGSIQAGLLLSQICLANLGNVQVHAPNYSICDCPILQISTDHAWLACMASQYAGWPVQADEFFAMGSGPMRAKRGREKLLEELNVEDSGRIAVGVLETETIPNDAVASIVAQACGLTPRELILCVAPTTSIAGTMQIVARSVETALHKLHTLGADVRNVQSAIGWAPIPPLAHKFLHALGRTNDAILYGGHVTLWVRDDGAILDLIDQIPSVSSPDFGTPFAQIFASYGHDFYKIDPRLFAPAKVTVIDVSTGRSKSAGELAQHWVF
jgi:methenyltetrahydromethanopterin cyclohydrolase